MKQKTSPCPLPARRGWNAAALAAGLPALLGGCATEPAGTPAREEIYVLRSVPDPATSGLDWCTAARTGFEALPANADRRFSLWTVQTRTADGRIVNAQAREAGELRTCLGATAEPGRLAFYGEGRLNALTVVGKGECRLQRPHFPQEGLTAVRCVLDLSGLPAPYRGGMLTSNTMVSKATAGGETDPPGYLQASIATIRLWAAR